MALDVPAGPERGHTLKPVLLTALAAASAAIGGALWAVKSLSILMANTQPDYTFELAPFFFGIATFGLVSVRERIRGRAGVASGIAWITTGAGAAAGVIYTVAGDVDAFGMTAMVSLLALLSFLLYVGWSIRAWSEIPWALAWLIIVGIPVGGALAAVNERLLEVPLLVVALGWLVLAFQLTLNSNSLKSELKPI